MANAAVLAARPHAHLLNKPRRRSSGSTVRSPTQTGFASNRSTATSSLSRSTTVPDVPAYPTSSKSLQEFRMCPTRLYYAGPSETASERRLVCHDHKPHNPSLPNMEVADYGGRWVLCYHRFIDDLGGDDWLAVKQASLSKFRSTEDAFAEYDLLRTLDHPHIITTVGAYTKETSPGQVQVGVLLYPLAPNTLARCIKTCSDHNDAQLRRTGKRWRVSDGAYQFLPFFACICDALSYLHGREQPVKHKDIKTENLLIDKSDTVILADFDRAATYPSREAAISQGPGDRTNRYASAAVMKQENRGFDRDVAPLGFVFVEMATVVLGETLGHMNAHCKRDHWFENLDDGLLDSWIEHLRNQTLDHPERVPYDFMRLPERTLIDKFLDTIKEMAHAGINEQGVLENALEFFRQLPQQACKHCGPDALVDLDVRGEEASAASDSGSFRSQRRDTLIVPGPAPDRGNLRPTPRPPEIAPSHPSDVEMDNKASTQPEIKILRTNTSLENVSLGVVTSHTSGGDDTHLSPTESDVTMALLQGVATDHESITPQLNSAPPTLAAESDELDAFKSSSSDDSVPRMLRIGSDFSSVSNIEGMIVCIVCIKESRTNPSKLKFKQVIGRDMKGNEVRIVPLYRGQRYVKLGTSHAHDTVVLGKLLSRRGRLLFRIGLLRTMLLVVDPEVVNP